MLAVALAWVMVACSEAGAPSTPSVPEPGKLVAEGRATYHGSCTACHNPDPRLEGVRGPPVFGSSRALLEAKLIHASYPPGYTPKRDTQLMQPLPYLAPQIPALAVFLNAR